MQTKLGRRKFLEATVRSATTLAALGSVGYAAQGKGDSDSSRNRPDTRHEEVSPAEDLMREHGVLNRVLLVYDEIRGRLTAGKAFPPEALSGAAGVIREFIEDYHEKLEEDYLFPRFEKAGKLLDLVKVLREQHQSGRRLTEMIKGRATPAAMKRAADRKRLNEHLRLFVRMYRPHESREDTVLFPAFRALVSTQEYGALGEAFEEKEHALFGEDGFERIVGKVARLEGLLGIADLGRFTAKV
ncbi:MAG: hemerythrin domain-containing protein [Acidobacteria bacterium]|nr:hemerythrin domain-containing protein [Acidobacteriota bacterium]